MNQTSTKCRNCAAELHGEYCSHCGQRERGHDLRFSEAAGEMAGDIFRWDSRLWRTIWPLMLRPGYLTAEFIAGRRARFVPPFRLYVIISFVMFLVVSLAAAYKDETEVGATASLVEGTGAAAVQADVDASTEEVESTAIDLNIADPNSPQWLQKFEQRMERNAAAIESDPQQFIRQWLDYLPQMMFLLLPLFALMLKLMYLGSPFHYLQHLVFSLHVHSFSYLLYLAMEVLEYFSLQIGFVHLAIQLLYLPLALRRCYSSGWPGALFKSAVLFFCYGFALVASFVVIVVLAIIFM